ncbi:unnamed protein product, partial [Rotaria sp. Silwood2]
DKLDKCELCGHTCVHWSKLTRHLKTHDRVANQAFHCWYCVLSFSVESTLEKHICLCERNQQILDLSSPLPAPSSNGSVENISSTIGRDRVNHFGEYISSDNGDIRRMIGTSLPYSQREFNQSEYSRHENNNSFEFISASNMIRYSSLLREISPYINRNLPITNIMLDMENNLLSYHFLLPKKCSIYL